LRSGHIALPIVRRLLRLRAPSMQPGEHEPWQAWDNRARQHHLRKQSRMFTLVPCASRTHARASPAYPPCPAASDAGGLPFQRHQAPPVSGVGGQGSGVNDLAPRHHVRPIRMTDDHNHTLAPKHTQRPAVASSRRVAMEWRSWLSHGGLPYTSGATCSPTPLSPRTPSDTPSPGEVVASSCASRILRSRMWFESFCELEVCRGGSAVES
jgi:hypothetical protein